MGEGGGVRGLLLCLLGGGGGGRRGRGGVGEGGEGSGLGGKGRDVLASVQGGEGERDVGEQDEGRETNVERKKASARLTTASIWSVGSGDWS